MRRNFVFGGNSSWTQWGRPPPLDEPFELPEDDPLELELLELDAPPE